ncbi:30S ribosomal protein S4 [Thermoflexus sp.]|uniref:30S ribosomal protein S4 n=1 Tax=Thermoflexus sp. TaxID=1969742 RepID=UPI0025DE718B|nr:30S ribosomal protein S4 [Thermoflexus sp.]MDW8180433.1 30S ribosomal protein S4 [Anaerolineae bacterium]MCS6964954.1 30S ribosomal protein S4 [Thermoflexus sp.]MCS7350981.1 30S ribosomal protein S4 [Thermoflexus sp.]MCX7691169.1 30S ribosomal protein S4 [Thermoflexus sp.]MDW8184247.1 30S ribosomal protein S4 [Anaerolineae bacterium]
MARYIGPVCRLCRREGEKLYLKGERCFTPKCAIERRNYPPGQHGRELQFRRSRPSDYGLQLREKQKLRRIYGVLERQFRRYFEIALRARGMTGALLLILLERRLDNVVYRLGFAGSRAQARQLVRHGHFEVNGRKIDIPSYQVKPGDVIRVRDSSREKEYFKNIVERLEGHRPPPWLQLTPQDLSGQVLRLPVREEIDTRVQEHLIVEFYSR